MSVGSGTPVGGLYVTLSGDTDDFDRDMRRAGQRMDRTERRSDSLTDSVQMLEGAFVATAAAAAGLTIGLGLLVRRFGKVDTQFSRIQATSQATAAQMEAMRAEALQLGADMPTTMMDSADALYELTTAGMTATQATESLAGTTYLAVAGQLSMAEASSATTTVLNAWSLEASKAASIADMLASTSAASATEVREMADAFRYASSSAAQLGVSAQELSAFVGLLSDVGMDASVAGTSINNALLSLISPTEKAESALAQAGLALEDFYTASGELKDVNDILAILNSHMSDLSDVERQSILTDVFGIRGARAMAPAIDQVKRYNELLAESAQAQVAGGIERLGDLGDEELAERRQAVGFELQPGSTRSVLEQFRRRAEREGLTQEELAAEIEVGLDISPDAAALLAGDLVGDTDMGALTAGIESASTSAELAEASMQTLSGQIEQLTGSIDTFFYRVFQGASGPLSLLLSVLVPIGEALAENEEFARTFGVALVGLTGAAIAAAGATGYAYVNTVLLEGGLWGAATAAWGYVTSTRAAQTATWLMGASLVDLKAALLGSRAAQLATAASSITLSGAMTVASGAMSTAAAAALSLWAALGPIGWIVLGLIALFAAWKTGLLDFIGLGGEADAVINSIMWALGGLADVLGIAGGELGGVVGWLLDFLGDLLRIVTLPIVIPIKVLGVVLRDLGTIVGALLSPFDSFISILDGTATAADLAKVALFAIPGVGIIAWALDAAGALDGMTGAINSVLSPLSDLAYWLGYAYGVGVGLYDLGVDLVSMVFDPLADSIDAVAASFDAALESAKAFFEWLDPRGEDQSWGDWLNPLPDDWGDTQRRKGHDAGKATSEEFSSGASDGEGAVKSAAGDLAGWVAGFLPSSDAQTGPLSNLTEQGRSLPQTFTRGVEQTAGIAESAGQSVAHNAATGLAPTLQGLPSLPSLAADVVPQMGIPSLPTLRPDVSPSVDSEALSVGEGTQGGDDTVEVAQGGNGPQIVYSPTFDLDLGGGGDDLDSIDERIREMSDRAIRELRRELETQLFRFQTGQ